MKPVFILLAALAFSTPTPAQQNAKTDSQIYRNSTFGFRYQVPYGWVDRTKEMQPEESPPAGAPNKKATSKDAIKTVAKGEVLLAVFEHPPQAASDTVNSAVVIATESAATYPGLKTAADYLAPLEEVTTAQGLKPAGEATDVEIDGRQLIRADYSRTLTDKLTMHQSTLFMLEKGKIVSFTFIAGTEEEIADLIERLAFGPPKPPGR
jgi:hypothetical protein